jgi:hypothetical protein
VSRKIRVRSYKRTISRTHASIDRLYDSTITHSHDDQMTSKKKRKAKLKRTASWSSSKFRTITSVVTGFASAASVADFGGFAKCILHFCTIRGGDVSYSGGDISYCDRPSLVLGLILRDKMRAALLCGNCMGLPVTPAESKRCVGGVRGTGDNNVAFVSRASTKGGLRDLSAAFWERLRASTTVTELWVDRGWEAAWGSLVVVVVVAGG